MKKIKIKDTWIYIKDDLSFTDKEGMTLPITERNGYLVVNKYPIHRLLAKVFIPNPDGKSIVIHKNGDKKDNRLENLEWADRTRVRMNSDYKDFYSKEPMRDDFTDLIYDDKIMTGYKINSQGYVRGRTGNILTPTDKQGSLSVTVSVNGKVKGILIHRAVAWSFIKKIDFKDQVRHIDKNKRNNNVENLEWVSQVYAMSRPAKPKPDKGDAGEEKERIDLNRSKTVTFKKRQYDNYLITESLRIFNKTTKKELSIVDNCRVKLEGNWVNIKKAARETFGEEWSTINIHRFKNPTWKDIATSNGARMDKHFRELWAKENNTKE